MTAPLPPTGVPPTDGLVTYEELQLATRNRGMPLEGLRYDVTPVGMHYLLTHYDIADLPPEHWRLRVGGLVRQPSTLTLDDLRSRPSKTLRVTMECAGNGRARLRPRPVSNPWLHEAIGTAEWTGTPLRGVLEEAGVLDDAVDIVFTGADHGTEKGTEQDYQRALSPRESMFEDVLLVYAMNGRPLEPQHGAPVRLVVPGWYGMASVKWLVGIEAIGERFAGHQQRAYSFRATKDDPGDPVTLIRVRALMIPPGFPDYLTRARVVERGPVTLHGRAWAGRTSVARVEVGIDGEWSDAKLEPSTEPYAWSSWSFDWSATPGEHTLSCRATDAGGAVQPLDQPWNYGGFGNNSVQQVKVTVR